MDRTETETEIKVYSNQNEVALLVDDKPFATLRGEKVFIFRVPISGEHQIEAVCGELSDKMTIHKVDSPAPSYCKAGGQITNWFDREDEIVKEGFFSIKDPIGAVKSHPLAGSILDDLIAPLQAKVVEAYGDVAKDIELPESVLKAMELMSVEATLKQMGGLVTPEFVHRLNSALNQIQK